MRRRKIKKANKNDFKPENKIKFYLQTSIGDKFEVSGYSDETFQSVLNKFKETHNNPKYKNIKTAVYRGGIINNNKTLLENEIEEDGIIIIPIYEDDDIIFHVNKNEIKFYLQTSIGEKFEVTGEPHETFQSVINKFKETHNSPEFENLKTAIYNGLTIDYNKTIYENNIEEGSIILVYDLETPDPNQLDLYKEKEEGENIKNNDEFNFNNFMDFLDDLNNLKNLEKSQELLYESFRLNNYPSNNNPKEDEEEEKEKITQTISTKHKHGLVFLLTNKEWNCNICGTHYSEKEPVYYCSLCDFSVCKNCIGNNNKYELIPCCHEQTKLKSHKFPFHKHQLIYCRTSRFDDKITKWTCDICDKLYDNKIWSFYCTICDYDLCLKCAKRYISDEEFVYNAGILIEKHDHPLVYMMSNMNWTCDLCSNEYYSFIPTYCCTSCDYNICRICKESINDDEKYPFLDEGHRKSFEITKTNEKCHEHPLLYCLTSRTNIATNWNCNSCYKNFGMDDWSFYCSCCDYDLCYDCYEKSHKES